MGLVSHARQCLGVVFQLVGRQSRRQRGTRVRVLVSLSPGRLVQLPSRELPFRVPPQVQSVVLLQPLWCSSFEGRERLASHPVALPPFVIPAIRVLRFAIHVAKRRRNFGSTTNEVRGGGLVLKDRSRNNGPHPPLPLKGRGRGEG